MMATPRLAQPITRLVVAAVVFSACKDDPKPATPAAPSSPAPVADAAAPPADAPPVDAAADTDPAITLTIVEPPEPGTAIAKRCTLAGPPLVAQCTGGTAGIVVDKNDVVYVASGPAVHRFRRGAAEPCALEPAGAPITLPPEAKRSQRIDGPVYMRSGGVEWGLARVGDAVYAHDFTTGVFRVDRGKPEPACTEVFGYRTLAALGRRMLVARRGIEELRLGKPCRARDAGIDAKQNGALYAVGSTLYAAWGGELERYEDGKAKRIAEGIRLCSVSAVTACGDGTCILDNNCSQLVQLAPDGSVAKTIDDKLFEARPYSLRGLATARDGTVYIFARHRDEVGGRELCEVAVYAVPPSTFER